MIFTVQNQHMTHSIAPNFMLIFSRKGAVLPTGPLAQVVPQAFAKSCSSPIDSNLHSSC